MVLISEHEKRPFSLVRMTANFSTRHRPCERERATEHDEHKTQSYPLVADVHASSSGRPQWAIILWRQASLKSAKNCWIKRSSQPRGDGWDALEASSAEQLRHICFLSAATLPPITRLIFSRRYSRILALLSSQRRVASVTSTHA